MAEDKPNIDDLLLAYSTAYTKGQKPDFWDFMSRCPNEPGYEYLSSLILEDFIGRLGIGERPWITDYFRCTELIYARATVCRKLTDWLFDRDSGAAKRLGIETFGEYRTTAMMGFGGFGVAFRAKSTDAASLPVAIKLAHPDSSEAAELLESEVRVLAKLVDASARIPRLLTHGRTQNGYHYVVTSLLDGVPLSLWLAKRPNSLERLRAAKQLTTTVGNLRNHGCTHGDISLDNVLVAHRQELTVHLVDFGQANDGFTWNESLRAFSVAYAPPELLRRGTKISAESDLWSLATVIFAMLTDRHPFGEFQSSQSNDDWMRHLERSVPSRLPERFGEQLRETLEQCLSVDPGTRRVIQIATILSALNSALQIVQTWPNSPGNRINHAGSRQNDPALQKLGIKSNELEPNSVLSAAKPWQESSAEELHSAALAGDSEAQFTLGKRYADGVDVTHSDEEGLKWYRRAAEQGHADAREELILWYFAGRGTQKNESEAARWARIGADCGNARDQFLLGGFYRKGWGVQQDDRQASKWFQRAADQGYADAQDAMGEQCENGTGTSLNECAAVEWYQKAAEQGHAMAQFNLSRCYGDGVGVERNSAEASKWNYKAAVQGHASAQLIIGMEYLEGIGVEKNEAESVKWLRRAAKNGHPAAQNLLGKFYLQGRIVKRNEAEAFKWVCLAAKQGLGLAQINLGHCYEKGIGVEINEVEMVIWFRKAAEQGYLAGQYQLALCLEEGRGTEKNLIEAAKWYLKAIEQGHPNAAEKLQSVAISHSLQTGDASLLTQSVRITGQQIERDCGL